MKITIIISKIIFFIKLLYSTKISFKKLEKKEIIFFDKNHSTLLINKFKLKNYEILFARAEEFNFWILLNMILNFKFDLIDYYRIYILKISPKIVITLVDNTINFYKLKKYFYKTTFISIQNGQRTGGHNDIFQNKNFINSKDLTCDYFFVFNKYIARKYKNYIRAKYITHGSFRNNFIEKKIGNDKNIFLFISQYRENNYKEKINYEIKFLKLLKIYFMERKIRLHILLSSRSKKIQKKEMNFYKSYYGSNCFFVRNNYWWEPYKILDKYKNIIFIDSTLGYESISREKKVAIFSLRKNQNLKEHFGWPSNVIKKNISFFSAYKLNYPELRKILNNIYFCTSKRWKDNFFPLIKDQMPINKNNTLLKNKIDLILNKN